MPLCANASNEPQLSKVQDEVGAELQRMNDGVYAFVGMDQPEEAADLSKRVTEAVVRNDYQAAKFAVN